MKKCILTALISFCTLACFGQDKPNIPASPEGKAVVYFVRTSSWGFAINFSYFDSATAIGRTNGANYIRYECDPGHHLFWARSENRDYVEAELEAGKIYFLEAVPQMGAIKAGVRLDPVDPSNEKVMKRIWKLFKKTDEEQISPSMAEAETEKLKEIIERGLEQYQREKEKGKKQAQLEKNKYWEAK